MSRFLARWVRRSMMVAVMVISLPFLAVGCFAGWLVAEGEAGEFLAGWWEFVAYGLWHDIH